MEKKQNNIHRDFDAARFNIVDQSRNCLNSALHQHTEIRNAILAAREEIREIRQQGTYLDFLIKKHHIRTK